LVSPEFDVGEIDWGGRVRKIGYVVLTALPEDRTVHVPIPPVPELQHFLEEFRRDHPDVTRCGFLMMPFTNTHLHIAITEAIRATCTEHGLTALRADDHRYSDDLLPNIRTYMHGSAFGIAVFERLTEDQFNPNVSLEVGYMMALGKPVCLLKDSTLHALQADLVGRLYENFDVQRPHETLPAVLTKWLREKGIAR